ncbi:radical SAM/SPASM domain-containing protein [Engelhardtia mirabilis]|uniref:Radical SAM core domain-containing protein n=1 Tax=Engelhardtia mirabilis TaxID=2528011 RepID=A0A518BRG3_9BACT|nr:hypothetical protein Pla133_46890 [Planctomycetes bacterium Pla133]QDV03895.1 hypothetical protein Pla86_46870 [Planctomycetes bacterium Pla86]
MIEKILPTTVVESRIAALAESMLPGKRPSFHAFTYAGDHLVYDLLTGSVLEVSEPFFQVLRGIELREPAGEVRARLSAWDDDDVELLIDELETLHSAGLLRTEDTSRVAEIERLVADSLVQHHPRKMMLMVQSNCNLKCTYCYEVQSGFHSTGTGMDYETGVRSIEFLIQRSGRRPDVEITFFGGEPLLNFDLIKRLVDYSKSREAETGKAFYYQVTTNGTLLTDEIIAYMVEHEFSVMLSIDGPPELNDRHRVDLGGRGTGAKAIEWGKKLVEAQRAAGLREAMVRVTLTHQNSDGAAVESYLRSEGFGRVMLGSSNGRANKNDEFDLTPQDNQRTRDASDQTIAAYVTWLEGRGPRPSEAHNLEQGVAQFLPSLQGPSTAPSIRCGVGRNMQAITRDGKIYPCHRYAGEDAFLLGDLETGLDETKLRDYYDRLLGVKEEHCSKCWARITCGGQCPWYISDEGGAILEPDEESCNGIRGGHERLIYLVHKLRQHGRLQDLRVEVESDPADRSEA